MSKYNFPKVDLHLHLDGSFKTETLFKLGQERGIKFPGDTLQGYENYMLEKSNAKSVNDYLEMFEWPSAVLQDKVALAIITEELINDLANQGLRYAEIRFAPQLHTNKGLSQEEAVNAVLEGRRKALINNPKIKINIIACMMSFGDEKLNWDANMETIEICHKLCSDEGLVAIDLAGNEGIKLSKFKALFDKINEYKLNMTCHAGDSQDWTTVEDALSFGTKRIGHGHHIYENPELVRYAAKHKIALEICPTSNIQCKTRESFERHPAKNLLEMGLLVTINTDNMVMARTTLDQEYDHCLNEMGFEYNDLIKMNINSINCSFLKQEDKDELIKELESNYKI